MLVIASGIHAIGTIVVYVVVLLVVSDQLGSISSGRSSVLGRARWVWSRIRHHRWTPGGSGLTRGRVLRAGQLTSAMRKLARLRRVRAGRRPAGVVFRDLVRWRGDEPERHEPEQ